MSSSAKPLHHFANHREKQEKVRYIAQVLVHLPDEESLHEFTKRYLEAFSFKRLQTQSHTELAEFVKDRYQFLKEALKKGGGYQLKKLKGQNLYYFEVVYPHTSNLLITMERLFFYRKFKINVKVHPEIAALIVDGEVKEFSEPKGVENRLSVMYFEFEGSHKVDFLSELENEIQSHIYASQIVHQNETLLEDKMRNLKSLLEANDYECVIPKTDWTELVDWLLEGNFTPMGYAVFELNDHDKITLDEQEQPLGLLSDKYQSVDPAQIMETLKAHIWKTSSFSSYSFDTLKVKSPVQRKENLMRLCFKIENKDGGQRYYNVIGLLKRSSLHMKNWSTPVIHRKMKYIFDDKILVPGSYNYIEVIRVFSSIPKFELFRLPTECLHKMIDDLLSITDPNDVHCFSQYINAFEQLQVMVVLPRELYNSSFKNEIFDFLKTETPHQDADMIEILDSVYCRLHFYFDLVGDKNWSPDLKRLETEISQKLMSWELRVQDLVKNGNEWNVDQKTCSKFIGALPYHYRSRTTPEETIRDMYFLEKLNKGNQIEINLIPFVMPGSYLDKQASLLYIYSSDKIDLIHIMPILENMGVYVLDQLTTRIGDYENTLGYVQSFRIRDSEGQCLPENKYQQIVADLLKAIFDHKTENDPLNSLVLLAEMSWRSINVVILYRNLFLQLYPSYTREKVNSTLTEYHLFARLLLKYFTVKFSMDPKFGDRDYRLKTILPEIRDEYIEKLAIVEDMASDVILRRFMELLEQTVRTNFFIQKDEGNTHISIKVESRKLEFIPTPRPYVEIYVHDVGIEGVHLRFGKVARGGLRWSDRPDDFRKEVLGLVKTQQTKNVVIVPVGSKGGFVVKNLSTVRTEAQEQVQEQYKKFISGLLDITDNLDEERQPRHPANVMIYDEPDPYLVVAADKGTATFSDLANSVSEKYHFWLGDAFASGGSVGYDHKKEGITARGAWECVKLHFREKGKDIQTDPTTVVAIGDMSGDVFGNGMLLSPAIHLRAAFNHVHIFIDPNPDAEKSLEERRRLFELPRSTWKDYNSSLISLGGGVYDRKAKSIHLSAEVKKMLDVNKDVLSGEELIRQILRMETDLLWFGGIGTYIKATTETHAQVGDSANDSVRIDSSECRAKVIGEGANLGITQMGRRELDGLDKALNTDAIDNSAGVNMSDYEVNLKILLQHFLNTGDLKSQEERNKLLEMATDEVSELVLVNNRSQHRLLSMDKMRSNSHLKTFREVIRDLIRSKGMDAKGEFIPLIGELEKLDQKKLPLSRPTLAVLQAYVKMWVYNSLLKSDLIQDKYLEKYYKSYFPLSVKEKFGDKILNHPLKSEIIGTTLTNKMVNQAGLCFYYSQQESTQKSVEEITKVYLIIDDFLNAEKLRNDIFNAQGVSERDKYKVLIQLESSISEIVGFLLDTQLDRMDFSRVEEFKGIYEQLKSSIPKKVLEDEMSKWMDYGFIPDLAEEISGISLLGYFKDILFLKEERGLDVALGYRLVRQVNKVFEVDFLTRMTRAIEPADTWEISQKELLLEQIEEAKLNLVEKLIEFHQDKDLSALTEEELLSPMEKKYETKIRQYYKSFKSLQNVSHIDLTNLSVVIHRLDFV